MDIGSVISAVAALIVAVSVLWVMLKLAMLIEEIREKIKEWKPK